MNIEDNSYIKHTLGDRCFYRKKGRDDTMTLEQPLEGYNNCKEEDGVNAQWFEQRWGKLNINGKPWQKWYL